MLSTQRLPIGPAPLRKLQRQFMGFGIAPAPVQTLPKYIIPGNLLVMPLGPAGLWHVSYFAFMRQHSFPLNIYASGGTYVLSGWESDIAEIVSQVTYSAPTFSIQLGPYGYIVLTINPDWSTLSGELVNYAAGASDEVHYPISGYKDPIELFVPLVQTESAIPYVDPGLTVVQNAQQILMNQGVSRQPVIAAPLHPSPYIQPGSVMVIPLEIPHGLWKIAYVVGGVTNTGQLEIAEVEGQLIGRMNVSGGMLYGSSGWETISSIKFGGIISRTLSFVRDYTRQKWEGTISGPNISGTYGGGPTAGGGTFSGTKQPIEIYVPTDITEYTKQIVVTKEMPLATLIPIETVSGKSTGQVVIEQGFAPTKAEAIAATNLLPTTQVAPVTNVSSAISKAQELVKSAGIPPWLLIAIGGGVLLMMGRRNKGQGE
jgi:hypothetical protein